MKSHVISAALLGGAIAVSGVMVASPAWADSIADAVVAPAGAAVQSDASDVEIAGCYIWANKPYDSTGSIIKGRGGRSGCATGVTLTVRIQKHRTWWPDKTIASTSAWMVNGYITASGKCDGKATYFTETLSSSGNKVQSDRATRCAG